MITISAQNGMNQRLADFGNTVNLELYSYQGRFRIPKTGDRDLTGDSLGSIRTQQGNIHAGYSREFSFVLTVRVILGLFKLQLIRDLKCHVTVYVQIR